MEIDVILISDAKNDHFKEVTQDAINSSLKNEPNIIVNVIVIEAKEIFYENATTIRQDGEFGYNKYLNTGASFGNAPYIFFGNNDLLFGENWASELISAMETSNANSASPFCPISKNVDNSSILQNTGIYEGYKIREHFSGWAFCWRRALWEKIKLDENILFWCCDNATIQQLINGEEKHILVTNSIVKHLDNGSKTLLSLPESKRIELMYPEVKKFNKLYEQNLFGLGI
jgi:GT2 family glycosyltransferase